MELWSRPGGKCYSDHDLGASVTLITTWGKCNSDHDLGASVTLITTWGASVTLITTWGQELLCHDLGASVLWSRPGGKCYSDHDLGASVITTLIITTWGQELLWSRPGGKCNSDHDLGASVTLITTWGQELLWSRPGGKCNSDHDLRQWTASQSRPETTRGCLSFRPLAVSLCVVQMALMQWQPAKSIACGERRRGLCPIETGWMQWSVVTRMAMACTGEVYAVFRRRWCSSKPKQASLVACTGEVCAVFRLCWCSKKAKQALLEACTGEVFRGVRQPSKIAPSDHLCGLVVRRPDREREAHGSLPCCPQMESYQFFFFCDRSAVVRPSVHMLPGTGWCGVGLPPFPTACWWLTHPATITGVSVSARWDSPGGYQWLHKL